MQVSGHSVTGCVEHCAHGTHEVACHRVDTCTSSMAFGQSPFVSQNATRTRKTAGSGAAPLRATKSSTSRAVLCWPAFCSEDKSCCAELASMPTCAKTSDDIRLRGYGRIHAVACRAQTPPSGYQPSAALMVVASNQQTTSRPPEATFEARMRWNTCSASSCASP